MQSGEGLKTPEMGKERKYAGVLIKEQEIKGCLKMFSPGATGMNHNLPGLLGAYKKGLSKMPWAEPRLHDPVQCQLDSQPLHYTGPK